MKANVNVLLASGTGYAVFASTTEKNKEYIGFPYAVVRSIEGLKNLLSHKDYGEYFFERCKRGLKLAKERAKKYRDNPDVKEPQIPTIQEVTFELLKSGKFSTFAEAEAEAKKQIEDEEKKQQMPEIDIVGLKLNSTEAAKLQGIVKILIDKFRDSGSLPQPTEENPKPTHYEINI